MLQVISIDKGLQKALPETDFNEGYISDSKNVTYTVTGVRQTGSSTALNQLPSGTKAFSSILCKKNRNVITGLNTPSSRLIPLYNISTGSYINRYDYLSKYKTKTSDIGRFYFIDYPPQVLATNLFYPPLYYPFHRWATYFCHTILGYPPFLGYGYPPMAKFCAYHNERLLLAYIRPSIYIRYGQINVSCFHLENDGFIKGTLNVTLPAGTVPSGKWAAWRIIYSGSWNSSNPNQFWAQAADGNYSTGYLTEDDAINAMNANAYLYPGDTVLGMLVLKATNGNFVVGTSDIEAHEFYIYDSSSCSQYSSPVDNQLFPLHGKNVLVWSNTGNLEDFTFAKYKADYQVLFDCEEITDLKVLNDSLLVFTTDGVFQGYPNPIYTYGFRKITNISCKPYGAVVVGDTAYFVSDSGLYVIANDEAQLLSATLGEDYFKSYDVTITNINTTIYIGLIDTQDNSNSKIIAYDITRGAFWDYYSGQLVGTTYNSNAKKTNILYFNTSDSKVYELTGNITTQQSYVTTSAFKAMQDYSIGVIRKIRPIVTKLDPNASPITVTVYYKYYDYDTFTEAVTATVGSDGWANVLVSGRFFKIKVNLSGYAITALIIDIENGGV